MQFARFAFCIGFLFMVATVPGRAHAIFNGKLKTNIWNVYNSKEVIKHIEVLAKDSPTKVWSDSKGNYCVLSQTQLSCFASTGAQAAVGVKCSIMKDLMSSANLLFRFSKASEPDLNIFVWCEQ